jgi:hypothetical protein
MKTANDLHFAHSPRNNLAQSSCSEPETAGPGTHPSDSADGANWESAWIDLGGEG